MKAKKKKKAPIKKITVLGEKYKIIYDSLIANGIEGLCDPLKKAIFLETTLLDNKEHFDSTLLHELGHAVFYEGSIRQTISHEVEEIVVDMIARVISKNFILIPR